MEEAPDVFFDRYIYNDQIYNVKISVRIKCFTDINNSAENKIIFVTRQTFPQKIYNTKNNVD